MCTRQLVQVDEFRRGYDRVVRGGSFERVQRLARAHTHTPTHLHTYALRHTRAHTYRASLTGDWKGWSFGRSAGCRDGMTGDGHALRTDGDGSATCLCAVVSGGVDVLISQRACAQQAHPTDPSGGQLHLMSSARRGDCCAATSASSGNWRVTKVWCALTGRGRRRACAAGPRYDVGSRVRLDRGRLG